MRVQRYRPNLLLSFKKDRKRVVFCICDLAIIIDIADPGADDAAEKVPPLTGQRLVLAITRVQRKPVKAAVMRSLIIFV